LYFSSSKKSKCSCYLFLSPVTLLDSKCSFINDIQELFHLSAFQLFHLHSYPFFILVLFSLVWRTQACQELENKCAFTYVCLPGCPPYVLKIYSYSFLRPPESNLLPFVFLKNIEMSIPFLQQVSQKLIS
jgi:hypothetical protein